MHNEQIQPIRHEHKEVGELPIAFPYVPPQHFTDRYSDDDAIIRGTLFPELDLPFKDFTITEPLQNNLMTEKMKIDFVCLELKLYLDTHPHDTEALEYYREYSEKSRQLKEEHRIESERPGYDNWVFDPWPWE
ncbi:MAG: spore coat protein CotJB [Defluviitaleaceae bacterium]|nr:spore coat protein CotJB [Defluviitaleaceae bacterium]